MSKDVSIFKGGVPATTANRPRGVTALGKALQSARMTRRIAINTNGTFKRIVNGEQVGKAVRGELNIIIVAAQPKVSRVYYAGKYDPEAPAAPDCWSTLGDKPEAQATNPQAASCAACPQNIQGSGEQGGRACRFQRRLAVLVEGDMSGDVYQIAIPAKSLFGKGSGNVHPFESYVNFLAANHESPDTVVTQVRYNDEADSMELQFSPVRPVSDEEYELIQRVQENPATERLTIITVAEADGVTTKPKAVKEAPEPEPAPARDKAPEAASRKNPFEDDEEGDEEEKAPQPTRRGSRKDKTAATTVAPTPELKSVIDAWANDDADGE